VSRGADLTVYQLKHFKYSSHYWILKFLDAAGRQLTILDVGTADGYLGAMLKKRGHHAIGVEQDAFRAETASVHYERFHVADIETFEFPYRDQFDVIVFADVLEHLRDPAFVLKRALPCLKANGEIIISLPNVANFVIRISVLFGRFDYRDRGILDRTHLRFFTLSTIRRLVGECHCRILETAATPIPLQLLSPIMARPILAPLHELHYFCVRFLKRLLGYQFVVRISPDQPRGAVASTVSERNNRKNAQ
jgi:SAM-dependent methyltransferase